MLKKISILAILSLMANMFSCIASESSELHRFATYNIRYTNDASDTKENGRAWYVRSQYVYNIIRDNKFDVFGMEEVSGRTGKKGIVLNPSTSLSQREELVAELTEYSFLLFERDGDNSDYSYNAIAYKKAKYELMEKGVFWISPTPNMPSEGWDPDYTIRRTCCWAKLKVKSSGDIFYFFVAHCNYGASLDGPNGAKLITNKIESIAKNYPVILCGDFNMTRVNHETSYRQYASKLEDTRFIAEECFCIPTSNGETTYTTVEWTPLTKSNVSSLSGNEFDYIFCKHMRVQRRNTITENYGRSVNPSDHFPVMAICNLINDDLPKTVYVDSQASENGKGTIESPFQTITEALTVARLNDKIRVAAGVYKEKIVPKRSVILEGGYNSSFSSVVGKSELDGDETLTRLIDIPHYYDLTMSDFVVKNAKSQNRDTDGAIYCAGSAISLDNVQISNNVANMNIAGLFADCSDVRLNRCSFIDNYATAEGGGAYLKASTIEMDDCLFDGNKAKSGSAVIIEDAQTLKVCRSTISNNQSSQYGTFNIKSCPKAQSYNFLNNTFANNYLNSSSGLAVLTKKYGGAALYVTMPSTQAKFNFAHNTVVGNTSKFAGSNKANYGGSAINLYGGSAVFINNIIAGNFSENGIGDLYTDSNVTLSKEQYNLYTASSTVNISCNSNDLLALDSDSGMQKIATTLDGSLDADNHFVAKLADNGGLTPTVKVVNTDYAGQSINVLPVYLRLVESSFGVDMNGDGAVSGWLLEDQRGEPRNSKSVPGACEYIPNTGLLNLTSNSNRLLSLGNNRYSFDGLSCEVSVFNLQGIRMIDMDPSQTVLDLSSLPCGIYIICADHQSYRVRVN